MHHQNPHRCWSDGLPIYRHGWRRPWHTSDYVSPGHHLEEGSDAWVHDGPTRCYYTGDSDLTHVCVWSETDSCPEDGDDIAEALAGRGPDGPGAWMDTSPQTGERREPSPGGSHHPGCAGVDEAVEQEECITCPCRSGHPAWACGTTLQCLCPPPACINVRKTLVVGVEVDILEELVYEDTEVLHTQTVFDGCLEHNLMDSTSFCCEKEFLK
ncbi:uncharacterized protein LOC143483134 [Brachyhypopomus gauderio]|uniref:uncharacterized protein LOC143483134 n=1 Tax=Brachyhypopomus gauderio TaxID=698409 RepID=UPI0040421006